MSERTDDRDVLALLDRAAGHVPPLHLDRAEVVGRGRQIVRRRRVGAGGAGLGGGGDDDGGEIGDVRGVVHRRGVHGAGRAPGVAVPVGDGLDVIVGRSYGLVGVRARGASEGM